MAICVSFPACVMMIKVMLFEKQILIQREYRVEQYEKFRQRTDWIGGGE